eukprot:gene477-514_t
MDFVIFTRHYTCEDGLFTHLWVGNSSSNTSASIAEMSSPLEFSP